MSQQYTLDTLLPPCYEKMCGCVTHQVTMNQKACEWLRSMTQVQLKKLANGESLNLNQLTEEWKNHSTSYTDSKSANKKIEGVLSGEPDLSSPIVLALVTRSSLWKSHLLRECEVNKIELLTYGDMKVVKKSIDRCEEEILIHHQLSTYLSANPILLQMIPTLYTVEKAQSPHTLSCYMELVEGITLREAMLRRIDSDDFIITLAVLHGFLDLLHRALGFLHGDLTIDNIILRGYGQGKKYNLPIFLEDGELVTIEASFCPTLIDFGHSSTHYHCYTSWTSVPFRSTLRDIYMLYRPYGLYFDIQSEEGGVAHACRELKKLFGKEWMKSPEYILPLPIHCEELSHRRLLDIHLERVMALFTEEVHVECVVDVDVSRSL